MLGRTVSIPTLCDGVVRLRRWRENDLGCVVEATADPPVSVEERPFRLSSPRPRGCAKIA